MAIGNVARPHCFMHVPKCAGMSIHAALEAAFGPESVCPRRMDTTTFCEFHDFNLLQPPVRNLIAVDDDEIRAMRRFPVVSGHFALPALLEVTDAAYVGTILREPRARLLSLYMYWRIPKIFDHVAPYNLEEHSLQPLATFLSQETLAPATDNQICRMLLRDDQRIPSNSFIAKDDIDGVATDAIEWLNRLGFVGILELGSSAWQGLGALFGVELDPRKINVTGESDPPTKLSSSGSIFTLDVRDLIEQRSAADRILYCHALNTYGSADCDNQRVVEGAFRAQMSRTQELLGN